VACHFQPDGWFWALRETDRAMFARVVEYERAAFERNGKASYRLRAGRPIAEVVERWRERNPTATVEAVLAKSYERPCGGGVVSIEEPRGFAQLSLWG